VVDLVRDLQARGLIARTEGAWTVSRPVAEVETTRRVSRSAKVAHALQAFYRDRDTEVGAQIA